MSTARLRNLQSYLVQLFHDSAHKIEVLSNEPNCDLCNARKIKVTFNNNKEKIEKLAPKLKDTSEGKTTFVLSPARFECSF